MKKQKEYLICSEILLLKNKTKLKMGKTKLKIYIVRNLNKIIINMNIYTRGWSVRECTVSSQSCNRGLIAKVPGTTVCRLLSKPYLLAISFSVFSFLKKTFFKRTPL